MSTTDAMPVPKKNTAYRHYFRIWKDDGSLLETAWTSLAVVRDLDGSGAAAATNTPQQIGTTSRGYIEFTPTEMNVSNLGIKATVANTGAVPSVDEIYPEETGDIRTETTQWNGVPLSTTNPVAPAQIRSALGLPSANLETLLSAISTTLAGVFDDADVTAMVDSIIARVESDLDGADLSVQALGVYLRDAILNRVLSGNHDDAGTLGALAQLISSLALEATAQSAKTAAEAVKTVTDKLDDTLEDDLGTFRFTINALEQAPAGGGGGGGGTIVVSPLSGNVPPAVFETKISVFVGETKTISIGVLDEDGDPVDVSGLTLELVIEDKDKTEIAIIPNASITKVSSTVSFALPAESTTKEAEYCWALRNTSGNAVLLRGPWFVSYAPDNG